MSNFRFVSRYSISNIDFTVVDASNNAVNADIAPIVEYHDYASGTLLFTRATTPTITGTYRVTLSSVETATAGLFYLLWTYALSAVPQTYRTDVEVPSSTSSIYDTLSNDYRGIVDGVWSMFEDLFDSDIGGPHLKMYAQTRFGRESVARLMSNGLDLLNSSSQPHNTFTIAAGNFPFTEWSGLLSTVTYIKVIQHLMRSYVEQPLPQGVTPARLDRRDYLERWNTILETAMTEFNLMLPIYRISMMNLGRTALLVAGGLYGNIPSWNPAQRPSGLPPYVR